MKDLSTIEPSTTKAAAIKWALELAKLEKCTKIIVESDTKVCVDAINGRFDYADWRIIDIYTEAKLLVSVSVIAIIFLVHLLFHISIRVFL